MTVLRTMTLDQCCEIVSGATPKTVVKEYWDGDICWTTPKDLSNLETHYLDDTPRKITKLGLASCGASVLPPGSVLFSSRAPIGHVAINAVPMATNQGFKSFVPKTGILDAKFLFHWLRKNRAYLESLGNGATFKEVSKATVSRIEIALPPIADQRRISAILDQADALRVKRREALAQLDSLTQSIFIEMFGDPATNPKSWNIRKIGDLLDSASYGTSEKSEATGDFPVLRMNNITRTGEIDLNSLKYMNLDTHELDRYLVKTGDILFNRTNSAELVGKSAIFRHSKRMAYAGYLVRLRSNAETDSEYLAGFLNTAYAKKMLRGMCKSIIGMANINAKEVQAMKIAQPPTALQHEYGLRIKEVMRQKDVHRASLAEFDELFASLQHRAFRGEL